MPRVQSAQAPKLSPTTPYNSKPVKPKSTPISWTDEQDKIIVAHVLAKSNIDVRFDWPELIRESFPGLTPKQIQNHWEKKVKPALFPNLANITKSKAGVKSPQKTTQQKGGGARRKEVEMKYEETDSGEEKDDFDDED